MRNKVYRYFACDFETTVYEGQEYTEVWSSAFCELFRDEVTVHHSIEETFNYFKNLPGNIILYYHNLKFDGSFWISFLLTKLHYEQAIMQMSSRYNDVKWINKDQMKNKSFQYLISDMGQWYTITIKVNDKFIEIRDSFKLLPFSLRKISKDFGTKHKKLEMEYTGFRYAGCPISDEELAYIKNDIYVLKEALEIMFTDQHTKLTIGSCCIDEYKHIVGDNLWNLYFPNLYSIKIDPLIYNANNADEYIRKSYRGGWCYVAKGKEGRYYCKNNDENFVGGITADVNSLYPSMMHSESGNLYPTGFPHFWSGNTIPDICSRDDVYYFIRIKTRFKLKSGFLPCIQVKNNYLYRATEWLETSDIYSTKANKFYDYYIDYDEHPSEAYVVLTLTMTDYELIKKHYNLYDFEILDGCYFVGEVGIFDDYIDKYKKIKLESQGAMREEAKLFLNNLYGRLAISPDSSFKYAFVRDDKSIGYYSVPERDKETCYVAAGSAITSYARRFTITAAQENYYGKNNPGFIYADTDSIHCDLPKEKIKGLKFDENNFCCWKIESEWDEAIFIRQKTYIEHINKKGELVYSIKCAGLPEQCKELYLLSMKEYEKYNDKEKEAYEKLDDDKKKFVDVKRHITDFKRGLMIPGKLLPMTIPGGIILTETEFTLR